MGHRKHETPQQRYIRRLIESTKFDLSQARKFGGDVKNLERLLRELEQDLRDASRA